MRAATMGPRGFGRTRAALVALVALLAVTGCGDAAREAEIYRVQRGYWLAYRAGQEAAMRGAQPDSTELLAIRQKFIAAVDQAAPTIKAMGPGKTRGALDEKLLRVVGFGEVQAGRLAMDADRPDLALERMRALVGHAEGDTAVTRQADIMIAGALRRMGRHEEAIEAMRGMLKRYPPHPPDSTGVEDFILTIPTLIVSTRKELGDEAGEKRELEASRAYYEGLLSPGPLDPRLEAQVRLHLVHSLLELDRKADALAALDAAETAVMKEPSLASSIPEIRYTRIKLTGLDVKDPSAPVAALERIAFDFPQSGVAPLALYDAAFLLERSGQLERARAGYEAVAARYPREAETAASALLRQAILEDRLGAWDEAKTILESIPTKYPFTAAAAQAPMTAAEHYVKKQDTAGTRAALRRGVEIYQRMIAADSLGAGTPRLRWNLIRCYASLNDTPGTFRAVDGMVAASPTSSYAAMALLGGAKLAEDKKMRPKAAAYLNRFLQEFPNSPEADRVRARLRELAK